MFRNFRLFFVQAVVLVSLSAPCIIAQADEPYIGEIRWFAGNFAPRGYALCDGQLLQISQHTALFSILGTTYGGDGRTTFALPDLRGRGMVHNGAGHPLGQKAGTETQTLTSANMPSHTHKLRANDSGGDSVLPDDRVLSSVGRLPVYDDPLADVDVDMHSSSIAETGGGQSHNNMQPSIALNCIIALVGAFPPRNNVDPVIKPGAAGDPTVPITLPHTKRN